MAERVPQIFLTVVGDADEGLAKPLFDENRVTWSPLPLGATAIKGWLEHLAANASADDLAIVITHVPGLEWNDKDREEGRRLAASVPCRRVFLVDRRTDAPSVVDDYLRSLASAGEVETFSSREALVSALGQLSTPFANTAPPRTKPRRQPRVTTAGVGGSGVADVAADSDTLGFEPYVNAVAAFLAHPQTAVPLTMSVEGPWGAGKSSFMLQLETKLGQSGYRTIRFNAWRHEKAEELWAAFALHFVKHVKPKTRLARWRADLRLAVRGFDFASGWPDLLRLFFWFGAVAAATITLGTMIGSAPELLERFAGDEKSTLLSILGRWFGPALGVTGWFAGATAVIVMWQKFFAHLKSPIELNLRKYLRRPDYDTKVAFIDRFQSDLRDVCDVYLADKKRVFVFIDDLDRCELPQAAELMRAINLMLSDTGSIVFVIGMDREKVAAALAVKHEKLLPFLTMDAPHRPAEGEITDSLRGIFFGYEYIEKFIQIPFAVPAPSALKLDAFLSSLAPAQKETLLSNEATRNTSAVPGSSAASSGSSPEDPKEQPKLHEFIRPLDKESEHLAAIARRIAPALGNNPRRLKQFVNLFRLRVLIGFATGLFVAPEDTPEEEEITLEKLAKFIAIELRWPLLLEHIQLEPELLRVLELLVNNKYVHTGESTDRVKYWRSHDDLTKLLRAGFDDANGDWRVGQIDINRLMTVSVRTQPAANESASAAGDELEIQLVLADVDVLDTLDKHEDAIALLEPLERFADSEPLILQRLGYHYLWTDPSRALAYSQRYMSLRPADPSGPFNASCAAAQLGQREEALRLLRQAIAGSGHYASRAATLMKEDFLSLANDSEFLHIIGATPPVA